MSHFFVTGGTIHTFAAWPFGLTVEHVGLQEATATVAVPTAEGGVCFVLLPGDALEFDCHTHEVRKKEK